MQGVGILAFGAGSIFLSMALVAEFLNSMAKRRQAVERFETLFVDLLSLCLVGGAILLFVVAANVVRG